MIASIIALTIDLGVMYMLVEFFSVQPLVAKMLGTGVALFFNYISRQFFIFSPETD
jgi:putative flippase GtrA